MSILEKISNQKMMLAAVLLLAIYPIAILAARLEIWHFRNSFLLFILSALLGFGILVISILKMSKIGGDTEGKEPARYLVISVAATLLPLMLLGSNVYKAQQYPFIHDISTDVETPPEFVAAQQDRKESDHSVSYEGEDLALTQKKSYPDINSLIVKSDAQQVFNASKALMSENGWDMLAAQNQQMPFTLEAVSTSALFAFKDDVVIRIQSLKGSVQVDVRSMSRQGKSDLGVNAKRINEFLASLQSRL